MKIRIVGVIILLLGISIYLKLTLENHISISSKPLGYDEVDYLNAASFGYLKNGFSKDSPNIIDFSWMGYYKIKNDTSEIIRLINSGYPNQGNDPFFLRHYHPVLPVYFWQIQYYFKERNPNFSVRLGNLILNLCFSVVIFLFLLKFENKPKLKTEVFFAILFGLVLLSTSPIRYSFESLNFHNFLAVLLPIYFLSYYKSKNEPSNGNIWFLGISTALLVLTLETSIFILGFIYVLRIVKKNPAPLELIKHNFWGPFFATLLIFWPAFFTKLEYLKTIGMYFFRIFGKKNEEYGSISYLDVWMDTFKAFSDFFLISILIFLFIILNNKNLRYRLILYTSLFYFIIMTPFLLNKTYIFPGITLLITFLLLNLKQIKFSKPKSVLTTILLIISVSLVHLKYYNNEHSTEREYFNKTVDTINDLLLESSNVLVEDGHIFNFYLPIQQKVEILDIPAKNNFEYRMRFDFLHLNILDRILRGEYDFIVLRNNQHLERMVKPIEESFTEFESNPSFVIYKKNI